MNTDKQPTVSLLKVASQASLMLRARAPYLLLYVVGWFVCVCLFISMWHNPPQQRHLFFWVLMMGCVILAPSVSSLHFIIASCRNRTSFFPKLDGDLLCFQFFLFLALGIMSVTSAIFISLPASLVALGLVVKQRVFSYGWIFTAATMMQFGALLPLLRFGPIIGITAGGDVYGLAHIWRMTRGYTFKTLVPLTLIAAPGIWSISAMVTDWAVSGSASLLWAGISFMTVSASWLSGCAFFGIFYEELNKVVEHIPAEDIRFE